MSTIFSLKYCQRFEIGITTSNALFQVRTNMPSIILILVSHEIGLGIVELLNVF